MIAEQPWLPLVGFPAHEAVEILEAHPARPLVEGSGQTVLSARSVVVLAEPRRGIAVLLEYFADGRILAPNDGVVPGVSGGLFGDDAEAHGVMAAASDQCRSRGRAERR